MLKHFTIALLTCLSSTIGIASAQTRTYDDGHVTPLPAEEDLAIEEGIVFGERGLLADIYRPGYAGAEALPVVVLWNSSRPDLKDHPQYTGWGRLIAGAGLAALTYEGALATAEADGDAIMTWLAEKGADHGLDSDRVCIWGCSGNVAQSLPRALNDTTATILCAVAYYGAPRNSPELRHDLPLFLARAGLDSDGLNRRIDTLASSAIERGVPLEYHNYAAGSHGFELVDDTDESRRIVNATLAFMRSHLDDNTRAGVLRSAMVAEATEAERSGDLEEAIVCYTRLIDSAPEEMRWRQKRASASFYAKQYDAAIDDYQKCVNAGFAVIAANYNSACAAALVGNKERALGFLEAAFAAGFNDRQAMIGDTDLATLRDELRFKALTTGQN